MSEQLPLDLRRVDPAQAWEAWKPDARDPWDARRAAHLFRRAAFGAAPERIASAVRSGVEATVKELLAGEPKREKVDAMLADAGGRFASSNAPDDLRGWWVYGMLNGGHPLREKMTLFWHNHFATSIAKVKSLDLMYRQNQLLRKHALGKFGPFVREVGRDVAMLVWLDSVKNVKGRPNENYARELMELFTLGVGNYTEKDVQEAARAFTGWHADDEQGGFAFDPDEHDGGTKTVLGRSGKWDGDAVVPILLDRPACARFLAGKLYREFVAEADPPPALLEPLARRFRASGYDIADVVGTILRSRLFYSTHAFHRRIKSPVEFALGAVQSAWPGPASPADLVSAIQKMGQNLFAPPNVKGWPGGRSWLDTTTLLARNNFAEQVAMGQAESVALANPIYYPAQPPSDEEIKKAPPVKREPRDPSKMSDLVIRLKIDPTRPGDAADALLDLLLPGCAPPDMRKQIAAFIQEGDPKGVHLRARLREAAHAILCSAEYQLA